VPTQGSFLANPPATGAAAGFEKVSVLVGVTGFEPVATAVRSECGHLTCLDSIRLHSTSPQLSRRDRTGDSVLRVAERGGRADQLLTAPRIASEA
jgi:hypothetical protein